MSESPSLPQPLTRICRYEKSQYKVSGGSQSTGRTYLQRVLAREALIAVRAGERFHGQMNPLMTLEIVVAVEALRTLVAFEWPVGSRHWYTMVWWVGPIEMLCTSHMTAVEPRQKPCLYATHHRHRAIGAVHVRHNRSVHRWQRVRGPWLARECQWWLSSGTLCVHPAPGVDAQTRRTYRG